VHTLEGKLIWITGAAGGIGGAITRRAREIGARCVLQSRREIRAPDERCVVVQSDVGTEEGVREAIEAAQRDFGQAPDLLCHTVGAVALGALARMRISAIVAGCFSLIVAGVSDDRSRPPRLRVTWS
jgi:NADP-dependent 3-hydroxy acid dehydrogenase YdfG